MLELVRFRPIVAGITMVVCLAPSDAITQQTASFAGEWITRLDFNSQPALLRITLGAAADNGLTATVSLLPIALPSANNAESRRISDSWRGARITVVGASWSFDAGSAPNSLRVEVRSAGDSSTATVTFRNETATASIHHLVTVDRSRLKQYAGT